MRMRGWWISAAAITVIVLAGGCSSSSSKDKTPAGAPSAAAPSSSNRVGGEGVPDIKDITAKFANVSFQANYKVTGSGTEGGGGEMQLFKQGRDRLRFDITATQNGQPMSVMVIQKDGTSAFCLRDAGELAPLLGVDAGKGVCFKSNPDDSNNPLGNLSTTFSDIENADVTVLDTSTRTVAGRDASCYHAKDNTSGDVSTVCFAGDGALLYMQTEGADANTIEATDVKSSVDGNSFDLPFEVKDFPGVGSQ